MEHDYFFKIGRTLKIFRKGYKLTQNDVASYAGVALSTYSNYENNNRKPDHDSLIKICELFKIKPQDFFLICHMIQEDSLETKTDDSLLFDKLQELLAQNDNISLSKKIAIIDNDHEINILEPELDELREEVSALRYSLNQKGLIKTRDYMRDLMAIPEYKVNN